MQGEGLGVEQQDQQQTPVVATPVATELQQREILAAQQAQWEKHRGAQPIAAAAPAPQLPQITFPLAMLMAHMAAFAAVQATQAMAGQPAPVGNHFVTRMTRRDWSALENLGWITVIWTFVEAFEAMPSDIIILPDYQEHPHGIFHHVDENVWGMGMSIIAGCVCLYLVSSMRGDTPAKDQLWNRFMAITLGAAAFMATDMAVDAKMITGYNPSDPGEFTGVLLVSLLATLLLLNLAFSIGQVDALKDAHRGERHSFLGNMLPG